MNISIFGLGYVGCVGMACLASKGHRIIGVDLNPIKVDFINAGKSPIVEKEMDDIISAQHNSGTISATSQGTKAVYDTEVSFICVGTPSTTNGHLDNRAVVGVAKEIGKAIAEKDTFHVAVIRSTVLPGTHKQVVRAIEENSGKKHGHSFAVVSNPEFLREGTAIADYHSPPFTLIGSKDDQAIESMRHIYSDIDAPFIVTEPEIAELLKYVNNAFHALKISFANEIGNICKKLSIDSHRLMEIFCQDTKLNLSPYYLKPGFSYGGSCLPKDLKALRTIAHDHYLECPVIETVESSNELQKKTVLNTIMEIKKEKIGFLGLSFKNGTDDLRNSPIIDILEQLLGKGYQVTIYDKNVHLAKLMGANKEYILKKIPYISKFITDDPDELIAHSELIVVVNNDKQFNSILEKTNDDQFIYDLVNIDFKNKSVRPNYMGIAW